jgi:hypothetical protein
MDYLYMDNEDATRCRQKSGLIHVRSAAFLHTGNTRLHLSDQPAERQSSLEFRWVEPIQKYLAPVTRVMQ